MKVSKRFFSVVAGLVGLAAVSAGQSQAQVLHNQFVFPANQIISIGSGTPGPTIAPSPLVGGKASINGGAPQQVYLQFTTSMNPDQIRNCLDLAYQLQTAQTTAKLLGKLNMQPLRFLISAEYTIVNTNIYRVRSSTSCSLG